MPARQLHPFQQEHRIRLSNIAGLMGPSLLNVEERSFKMDAERRRAGGFCVDEVGQTFESRFENIEGSGYSRRQKRRRSVLRQRFADDIHRIGCGVHDVEAAASVDVRFDEAGSEDEIRKVQACRAGGNPYVGNGARSLDTVSKDDNAAR